VLGWLESFAIAAEDPDDPHPVRSSDAGDDYLVALSARARAVLVSGDKHLLRLAADIPVVSPGEFLHIVEERRTSNS
jgi:predicted nucleic acid-binding protein